MALIYNGSQINSLVWNGTETTGVWNGEVVWGSSPYHTLTLLTDGNGTLTAETLTGYPGDTVALTPTYNTYYRFDNYSNTGGSIDGNIFTFDDNDATVQANFKVNAFTASGGFEKGSDVTCSAHANWEAKTAVVPEKFATVSYHTSNVPAEWYETSNRWKVTTPVSAYQITLNAKMGFQGRRNEDVNYGQGGAVTAVSLIGSTQTQNQSFKSPNNATLQNWSYNKSFTADTTGVNYGLSAKLSAYGVVAAQHYYDGWSKYIANRTSGTWVATGIAP